MKIPSYLKPSKWLPSLIFFVVVFIAANIWATRNHTSGQATAFTAIDLKGESHRFNFQQNTGEPVLLHFFATWCPICELENGSLNNLSEDYQVIMIAMQSGSASEVKSYQQEHNLIMNIYNDENGELSKLYKVVGVPTSYIINAKGMISSSTIGYTSELGLRFRLWLSDLL